MIIEVEEAGQPFKDGVRSKKRLGTVVIELDLRAMRAGNKRGQGQMKFDNTDDL